MVPLISWSFVVVVDEGVGLEGNFIWENAWMKTKAARGGLEEDHF